MKLDTLWHSGFWELMSNSRGVGGSEDPEPLPPKDALANGRLAGPVGAQDQGTQVVALGLIPLVISSASSLVGSLLQTDENLLSAHSLRMNIRSGGTSSRGSSSSSSSCPSS